MAASIEELPKYFRAHSKIEEAQYHKAKVHSVGWNCDGRKLASGSTDRTVCTYTIDRDRLVCKVCHFLCIVSHSSKKWSQTKVTLVCDLFLDE